VAQAASPEVCKQKCPNPKVGARLPVTTIS
jgi:hypothetical protein